MSLPCHFIVYIYAQKFTALGKLISSHYHYHYYFVVFHGTILMVNKDTYIVSAYDTKLVAMATSLEESDNLYRIEKSHANSFHLVQKL